MIIWRILINEWIKQGLYMDKNKNMVIWKWCKENSKYGDQLTRNYRKICVNIFCCFYEFCSIWQRVDSLRDAVICFILTVNFGSRCDHYYVDYGTSWNVHFMLPFSILFKISKTHWLWNTIIMLPWILFYVYSINTIILRIWIKELIKLGLNND